MACDKTLAEPIVREKFAGTAAAVKA